MMDKKNLPKAAQILKGEIQIDQEKIIQSLKKLRFQQSAIFENLFEDYQTLSRSLLPIQSVKQNQVNKISSNLDQQSAETKSTFRNSMLSSGSNHVSEKESQEINSSNEQQLQQQQQQQQSSGEQNNIDDKMEQRLMRLQGIFVKQQFEIQQLDRENKNLRDESSIKSETFQDQIKQVLNMKENVMYSKLVIPKRVEQYLLLTVQKQQILVQLEQESDQYQKLRLVDISNKQYFKDEISGQIKHIATFEDTLILTEQGKSLEVWRIQISSEGRMLNRLVVVSAHNEQITSISLINREMFVTSSKKGVIKLWNISPIQLIASFRFETYATSLESIPQSLFKLPDGQYAIAAGFSNGILRILQFTQQQQLQEHTDKQWSCDIKYQTQLSGKDNQLEINTISIASTKQQAQKPENWTHNLIMAIGVTGQPDNIYLLSGASQRVFSLKEGGEIQFRNSSENRQFAITGDTLIAGSFNGQIFTWDISKILQSGASANSSYSMKRTSYSVTLSTQPVIYANYDESADELLTADQQGNILHWNQFMKNQVRK